MMSIGALKMPAMADAVPDSAATAHLAGEGHEVQHHGHAALDERHVVGSVTGSPIADGLATRGSQTL